MENMKKLKAILIYILLSIILFAFCVVVVLFSHEFHPNNSDTKGDRMVKLDTVLLQVLVLYVLVKIAFTVALMMFGHRFGWLQGLLPPNRPTPHHRRRVHRFGTRTRWNFIRPDQVPPRQAPAPSEAYSIEASNTYESVSDNNTVIIHDTIDPPDNTDEQNNQINDETRIGLARISHAKKNEKTNIADNVKIQVESLDNNQNNDEIGINATQVGPSIKWSKSNENNIEIQVQSSVSKIQPNTDEKSNFTTCIAIGNSTIKSYIFNVTNMTQSKNGLSYSVHFPKSTKSVKKTSSIFQKVSQNEVSTSYITQCTNETSENLNKKLERTFSFITPKCFDEEKIEISKTDQCVNKTSMVRKIKSKTGQGSLKSGNIFTISGRFSQPQIKEPALKKKK